MKINKHEARALVFWASKGFQDSIAGSYQDIPKIAENLMRRFNIPYAKKDFQRGTKTMIWLTKKSAEELWKASVGQKAKVPYVVKSDLYKIKKFTQFSAPCARSHPNSKPR